MFPAAGLLTYLDLMAGRIVGKPVVQRRLSDLRGSFADAAGYDAALGRGNPLIYSVSSDEPGDQPGDLHYGLGRIEPGRIGSEYYLTKGHLHAWREAAEVYIGLGGEGLMLLEDEQTGETRSLPLTAQGVVYVPGGVAHRTVNVGSGPLTYLGVYPARAGHDYGALTQQNFRQLVLALPGGPQVMDRAVYLERT